MGEIININIGKAGVKIGQRFLQSIAKQHFQDDQDKRGKANTFFNQTSIKTQQSRSLFIDLHPGPIENINLKTKNYIIKQNNLFKGTGLESDSYPVGHYLQGEHIVNEAFDKVRKQVQKCDMLSGFLLINSIGGGSGSGMTCKMLNNLKNNYSEYITEEHAVLPEANTMCAPLHIYNAVFAMHALIEQSDINFFAENSAFEHRLLLQGKTKPTMEDINQVHAQNITQTTAPYRFSGSINSSQRKTCVNMILFPRIKFMVSSFSNKNQKNNHIESALKQRNYSKSDFFTSYPRNRGIFSLQVNCRDNFAYQSEVDSKVKLWLDSKKLSVTQWLPNTVSISVNQPPFLNQQSSSIVFNSRHVMKTFQVLSNNFAKLFRKKAFIWSYLASGTDEMQFTEVQSNLNDIIAEYQPYYDSRQQYEMEEVDQQW